MKPYWLIGLVTWSIFAMTAHADMVARIEKATKHVKVFSSVPFTTPPTDAEQDVSFPDGTTLPGELRLVQVSPNDKMLQVDTVLEAQERAEQQQREQASQAAKQRTLTKLGLTPQEFEDLREALR